jgi:hypothetical protein
MLLNISPLPTETPCELMLRFIDNPDDEKRYIVVSSLIPGGLAQLAVMYLDLSLFSTDPIVRPKLFSLSALPLG